MRAIKLWIVALGIVLLVAACGAPGIAETPTYAPLPTQLMPTGTQAPPPATASPSAAVTQAGAGSAQVEQQVATGGEEYDDKCSGCHGASLQGISGPALTRSNVIKYGTASQLLSFISNQMPLGSAGSLKEQTYIDIAAYILHMDSLLPAGAVLTSQNAGNIDLAQLATQTPESVVASPTPQGTVVANLANIPNLGYFLTTPKGLALYHYDKDGPGTSNCTAECALTFSPYTVPQGTIPLAGQNVSGTFSTFQRQDGSYQLAYTNAPDYNQTPLYTFSSDLAGQIAGNGYNEVWHLVFVTGPSTAGTSPSGSAETTAVAAENAALGAPIYLENCTSCHGIEGEGVDAPALRNSQYIQSSDDPAIFDTIANGRPNTEMPAWLQKNGGPLTDAEIANVVAYIEDLQNVSPLPSATPMPVEPTETPLPPNAPTPEPGRPSFSGSPGPAASMTGNLDNGQPLFGSYCASCHGPQGVQGIPNLGSDDGTVPPLNPIDPTIANADAKIFATNVDLFIQLGSIPDGANPSILMPAFGSENMLTQQQIADIIAYVMSLNGVK